MFSKIHILKQIAFSLALIMFVSSVGIAMDFHFCQGDLQNISFFKESKSCHEVAKVSHCKKQVKKACHKANDEQVEHAENCCDNETIVIQLDTEFSVPSLIDFDIYKSFLAVNFEGFQDDDSYIEFYEAKNYKHYKPPSRDIDHTVLFQSFLI